MKIMVAIINYGMKNVEYAKQLIQEYRSMPFEVDIFVLSEAPKDYGKEVTVLVGLPSNDPWSLPFAHKRLFSENVDKYDVFIYTEDDTLVRKENIQAFLSATEQLREDILPGFIRYELYPNGDKNYTDIHGQYHWIPGSVGQSGEYTFAELSNDHSACYILTQGQLRKAIESGGFLVLPHSGRYDLICTAGTDPYTQCGFTRVICLSHLQEFELHHLSNAYLNRVGLDENGYKLQIEALQEVLDQKRSDRELFITEKPLATPAWDKNYYEPYRDDIVRMISSDAKDILSVGCGWGLTEANLIEKGKKVVAIPLDSVIGRLAEERGIRVLPPDFEHAFKMLAGKKFDAIILQDILQHLSNPIEILTKLATFLTMEGVLVGSIPSLSLIRRVLGQLHAKSNKWVLLNDQPNNIMLNLTNSSMLKKWLRASNLHPLEVRFETYPTSPQLAKLAPFLPGKVVASNIVFAAKRTTE
jgi:2-polyprenyl-3-methyl-5-hydroxy-6-metoxy-1,4-benzoquinol methylase